ncbi:hypothetical protein C8C93_2243 [Acidovorax sp. 93]|nr:hypothetical protein C8C93_2243 [Acidovorax sp. 93]
MVEKSVQRVDSPPETGAAQASAPVEPALAGHRVRPPPGDGAEGDSRRAFSQAAIEIVMLAEYPPPLLACIEVISSVVPSLKTLSVAKVMEARLRTLAL